MSSLISFKVQYDLVKAGITVVRPDNQTLISIGEEYNKKVRELYSKHPKKVFKILMDIRNVQRNMLSIPRKLVDYVDEITENEQTLKVAVLGDSKIQDLVVSILFSRFRDRKANYFMDEKRALAWLGMI